MSATPTIFFISMAVLFGTIIVVFGIRYFQAIAVAKVDVDHTDAYRKLASEAVTAHADTAARLAAIESELDHIKARITSVDTILKTVD